MTAAPPDGVPSWDEVVDIHQPRVHRLAYRLTGNRADAEDLTQEVLVRVHGALGTFRSTGPGSFEGWLRRVTTNLFLDQTRRRALLRVDPVDHLTDARFWRLAEATTPQTDLVESMLDGDVERALAGLAPEVRAAVVLCDVEGLSYAQTATVLGVRLGTVRSRIHRGRTQLRRALAHRAPRPGRPRYAGPLERPLTPSLS